MAPASAAPTRFGPIGLPEPEDSRLTKTKDWLRTRPAEKIAEWTGKETYTFGDLTKAAMRRFANGSEQPPVQPPLQPPPPPPPPPPTAIVDGVEPSEPPHVEELSRWRAWLRGRERDADAGDGTSNPQENRIRAWLRPGAPAVDSGSGEDAGWRAWLRRKAAEPDNGEPARTADSRSASADKPGTASAVDVTGAAGESFAREATLEAAQTRAAEAGTAASMEAATEAGVDAGVDAADASEILLEQKK